MIFSALNVLLPVYTRNCKLNTMLNNKLYYCRIIYQRQIAESNTKYFLPDINSTQVEILRFFRQNQNLIPLNKLVCKMPEMQATVWNLKFKFIF